MPSAIAKFALSTTLLLTAQASEFPAIIGGTDVSSGDNRFVTSIQTTSGSHFCGGSLISSKAVLTAAHCVSTGSTNFRVKMDAVDLRDSSGVLARPAKVYVHESYSSSTLRNDIAIIELSTEVTSVPPVTVDYTTTNAELNSGSKGEYTIAGWGYTIGGTTISPNVMQEVTLPVVPDSTCDDYSPFSSGLHDASMVCIGDQNGSRSACNGDSGGPMFKKAENIQIGLTSWGARGCTSHAVYTQLPYFESWIKEKLEIIGGGTPTNPPTGEEECKCVGGNDLDIGTTCGNWLWAGFNWCYSDVACPGATPSERYPGYYWFECDISKLDKMVAFENSRVNALPDLSKPTEKFYRNTANQQATNNDTPAGTEGIGMVGGLAIGLVSAGVVSAGLFAAYNKKRNSSVEAAIDRIEEERRVTSAKYEKNTV